MKRAHSSAVWVRNEAIARLRLQGQKQKQRKHSKKRKQRPPDQLGGSAEPLRYNDSGVGPTFFDEVHPENLVSFPVFLAVQAPIPFDLVSMLVFLLEHAWTSLWLTVGFICCVFAPQLGLQPAAAVATDGDMMAKYAAALDWDDEGPD